MITKTRRRERRHPRHERRETLLARLAEAEDTLLALREGHVDAIVVRGGNDEQVFTLHGAEEPYRILVQQMREGAAVLSSAGDILYANARFAGLVGEPLESVLGGQIGRFIARSDGGAFDALLTSGNGTCRSQLISSGGNTIEVYCSVTTTLPVTGIGQLTLIVTDLRELLEARSDRDRAQRDSRTTNEFLAMLAHELRNPLGAIRSAVGVLDRIEPAIGAATRAREVIARQVRHLSHLIDDLLDVERVASGKVRLNRRPLDLADAVRRALANFTGNLHLDRRIEVRTDPVWVDGDPIRLEQVLANIVTNAVKYTPAGGVIRVTLREDGDAAELRIEDTGVGIPAELLPSIFDMFVQGERTLDRAQGGLGIGLTLVRRLVELHGGTVTASSGGIACGTTFVVRLPRVPALPATAAALMPAPQVVTPRRVLLIEDSRDAREMLRMILELSGHHVYEADNGHRGLELMATEHPEVAIIDIGLPGLDGYQVATRIRAQPNGRGVLLLALSGYDFPSDYERSTAAGFDHHLVKPVDPSNLAQLLADGVQNETAMHAPVE